MELLIYYDLFLLSHNTCEIIVTRDSRERERESKKRGLMKETEKRQ